MFAKKIFFFSIWCIKFIVNCFASQIIFENTQMFVIEIYNEKIYIDWIILNFTDLILESKLAQEISW